MPLDMETYQANAEQCEDRAQQMPPSLRRELLMVAEQWRKMASLAEKRGLQKEQNDVSASSHFKGRTAMKTIVSIIAAIVLALAVMPANAASKHKRHTKTATAPQQQIACTVVGCIPVPRGCHPETGYTPWGTPTGFDVAACPNYTLYGFRR